MTDFPLRRQDGRPRAFPLAPEALAALAAIAFVLLLGAAGGFAGLADLNGDSDSLMRLAVVRDLLAGQAWFDPMQYRMGAGGGFAMHWSRLVDAPLALLIRLFGEPAALVLWPALLAGAITALVVRTARITHGDGVTFPAAVVCVFALLSIGIVQPAAIDHHNVQVALVLAMTAGLVSGGFRAGLAAGGAAALSLAVGIETLPYVAAGGAVAAMLWLLRNRAEAPTAVGFGLGFAVLGAAAFAATVPPSRWLVPACDAYSIAQASIALVAGLGLAIAAAVSASVSPARHAVSLAVVAALVCGLVVVAFPQCLADPYAGLDPRLRRLWLDGVVEAQSIVKLARHDPAMLAAWYATPLLGLGVLLYGAVRGGWRRADMIIGALLLAAILVSFWQVRGGMFSVVLAVVPLAGLIASRRGAAQNGARGALALALAWAVSFNAVWGAAGSLAAPSPAASPAIAARGPTDATGGPCTRQADFAELASMPPAMVLSVSNLGPAILAHTGHRAFAGPYHRNVAGNLATLDMFAALPAEAEALARRHGVDLVAICKGNSETRLLAREAPGGLAGRLVAGETPAWLLPVGGTGDLRLYRVSPR